MLNKKKAFTLIELLVVIAIIGLLATISVIALNNARAKGRDAKRVADIKQIQTALELFFNDKGRYPTAAEFNSGSIVSTSTNGTTTYMSIIPSAPNPPDGNCSTANGYIYSATPDGTSYSISFCTGNTVGSLASGGPKCATPAGMLNTNCCGGDISYGGESYPAVQIGTQCWLAKNLNIGIYVDSGATVDGYDNTASTSDDCIDVSSGSGFWSCQGASGIQKYCYGVDGQMGGNSANCITDGGLYEWAEAMGLPYYCNWTTYTCDGIACTSADYTDCNYPDPAAAPRQGVCPSGWHIPGDSEWTVLTDYLTNNNYPGIEGTALKALSPSWDGTDNFSFTILPAGLRNGDGSFSGRGGFAGPWSSLPRPGGPSRAWIRRFNSGSGGVTHIYLNRVSGGPVRCLRN